MGSGHVTTDIADAYRLLEPIAGPSAAIIFGSAPELVSSEQRRAAKTINFGILYGMSAFGLSQALGIPSKEAVLQANGRRNQRFLTRVTDHATVSLRRD